MGKRETLTQKVARLQLELDRPLSDRVAELEDAKEIAEEQERVISDLNEQLEELERELSSVNEERYELEDKVSELERELEDARWDLENRD